MARRERVTRLKSHRKTRNKNPKLSPFQREQRRNKMANQAPIVNPLERDAPKSQRLVIEYLEEKQRKKEAKRAEALRAREERQRQQAEAEEAEEAGKQLSTSASSSATSSRSPSVAVSPARKRRKGEAEPLLAPDAGDDKKTTKSKESLNALLGSSLGPAVVAFPTASASAVEAAKAHSSSPADIIARKKAKKHEKRVEARRERVREQVQKMEKELEELTKRGGRKKSKEAKDPNAAFEKQLKLMQQEKAMEDKKRMQLEKQRLKNEAEAEAKKIEEREAAELRAEKQSNKKKSISFDEEVLAEDEEHQKKKAAAQRRPRDFSDLVDVVRFNERVEAPPVFTAVPNKNASVSRLARRLEEEARREDGNKNLRHRLLSSVGGLGEQKRLSRLGLIPAATQLSASAAAAQAAKLSKEKEMETLRAHVMAAYQKKKRRNLEAKKGVDMTHQFPSL